MSFDNSEARALYKFLVQECPVRSQNQDVLHISEFLEKIDGSEPVAQRITQMQAVLRQTTNFANAFVSDLEDQLKLMLPQEKRRPVERLISSVVALQHVRSGKTAEDALEISQKPAQDVLRFVMEKAGRYFDEDLTLTVRSFLKAPVENQHKRDQLEEDQDMLSEICGDSAPTVAVSRPSDDDLVSRIRHRGTSGLTGLCNKAKAQYEDNPKALEEIRAVREALLRYAEKSEPTYQAPTQDKIDMRQRMRTAIQYAFKG